MHGGRCLRASGSNGPRATTYRAHRYIAFCTAIPALTHTTSVLANLEPDQETVYSYNRIRYYVNRRSSANRFPRRNPANPFGVNMNEDETMSMVRVHISGLVQIRRDATHNSAND
jgi:hypothetical protein